MQRAILLLLFYCTLCSLIWVPTAFAFRAPEQGELPNFDKRPRQADLAPAVVQTTAARSLTRSVSGARVTWDPVLATPRFISARDAFLTGSNGVGGAVSPTALMVVSGKDPHQTVKAFVSANAGLFGHGPEVLDAAVVKRDSVAEHNGMRTVIWEQQLDGIKVFEGVFIANITRKGELINVSSRMVPNMAAAANAGAANRQALAASPTISASHAVFVAASLTGENLLESDIAPAAGEATGLDLQQQFTAPGLRGAAIVNLVWLPIDRNTMRLCWAVELTGRTRNEMYRILVDAENGAPLIRHCLTRYITNASYRVYTGASPTPMSPGLSTPSSYQPPTVERVLVVTNALYTNASPNGWINDGVNETQGNNVDAHLDRNANDQPDLPRPEGSPARVFDFPMDLTQSPTNYGSASVVELFYWANWAHDQFYRLGFTEAAGNFQNSNFGRGGTGSDALQADAQDGEGVNNSNMSTPGDGLPPRMQMFIFTGPSPDRDGVLDTEIVLHEYTHGVCERMIGGGVGSVASQSLGMSEGWADFFALALLSKDTDDLGGPYPMAPYATRLFAGLQENYYFGIRRYPYSTNLAYNPLTFKDIDPTQASYHSGVPRSSLIGAGSPEEVHNQGEVWASMLWELRAQLVAKYGFETGNHLAMQLVIDGLTLTPGNPTFIEARDGILQADLVLTSNANRRELWIAFAKRGIGSHAVAPGASTTIGVVEDYSTPDDMMVIPSANWASSGLIGGPFFPDSMSFILTNAGPTALNWAVGTSGGLVEFSPSQKCALPGNASVTLTVRLSSAVALLPAGTYVDAIIFTNTVTGVTQRRTLTLRIGQTDFFTELFDKGSNDLSFKSITFTPTASSGSYQVCRTPAQQFPSDPAGGVNVTLGDDTFVRAGLTNGDTVSIYGNSSSVLYIGSNGEVTFTEGYSDAFHGDLNFFFDRPRVAPMYADLNPSAGGRVSWKQWSDRVAVTWQNVPEYGRSNTNNLQVEMFFNGDIRITWLEAQAIGWQMAGIAKGVGIPPKFAYSDFATYSTCGPALAIALPASVSEGDGVVTNGGIISIPSALTTNLVVSLKSSDTDKIAVPLSVTILAGHTTAHFDFTVLDNTLLDGTQYPRITASADGFFAGSAIIPVFDNESASLSISLPQTISEIGSPMQGSVSVGVPVDRPVFVRVTSSDTNRLTILSPGYAVIPQGGRSATFTIQPVDNFLLEGDQTVLVSAEVAHWQGASTSIVILDNEFLDITPTLPGAVTEGAGLLVAAGILELNYPLPTNLVVMLTSLNPAKVEVPASVTFTAGQTVAYFDLNVMDNLLFDGLMLVPIVVSTTSGLSITNYLFVIDNETPITPFNPQPTHLAINVPTPTRLSWFNGVGESIINGGFETGDFTGWHKENSGVGDWMLNDGTFVSESGVSNHPPYQGRFSAFCESSRPGTHLLWQEIQVPSGVSSAQLQWQDSIQNFAPDFGSNQQFRVELRDQSNAVIAVLFSTQPGSPRGTGWTARTFDLIEYRGQTMRLAFIEQDQSGFLNVQLDNVSLVLDGPLPSLYEVYLGTNSNLGSSNLIGVTSNSYWDISSLAANTAYYWRIGSRYVSPANLGPVWQFTTAFPASPTVLVSKGSLWRYNDTGVDLGTAWIQPVYDDHAWKSGNAPLGYGGNGEITVIGYGSDPDSKYPTAYFRRAFVVNDPVSLTNLTLKLNRDDGGVVYLNGMEVFRSNMPRPPAPITYNTYASTNLIGADEQTFFSTNVSASLLRAGTNIVSVEIHQSVPDSVDAGFDLELSGMVLWGTNQPPSARLIQPKSYALANATGVVNLVAEAGDSDGSIVRVEFFANGKSVGIAALPGDLGTNQYQVGWTNPPAGACVLSVAVTDNQGAIGYSAPVSILIVSGGGNAAPLVQWVTPTNQTAVLGPRDVALEAVASEAYGTVSKVEFFQNALKLGEITTPPYMLVWSNAQPGIYVLSAAATDKLGLSSTSAPVTIHIQGIELSRVILPGNKLQFSWPVSLGPLVLEQTQSLIAPSWSPVNGVTEIIDSQTRITLDLSGGSGFYRLRTP